VLRTVRSNFVLCVICNVCLLYVCITVYFLRFPARAANAAHQSVLAAAWRWTAAPLSHNRPKPTNSAARPLRQMPATVVALPLLSPRTQSVFLCQDAPQSSRIPFASPRLSPRKSLHRAVRAQSRVKTSRSRGATLSLPQERITISEAMLSTTKMQFSSTFSSSSTLSAQLIRSLPCFSRD
jgi:hypothetical protein